MAGVQLSGEADEPEFEWSPSPPPEEPSGSGVGEASTLSSPDSGLDSGDSFASGDSTACCEPEAAGLDPGELIAGRGEP